MNGLSLKLGWLWMRGFRACGVSRASALPYVRTNTLQKAYVAEHDTNLPHGLDWTNFQTAVAPHVPPPWSDRITGKPSDGVFHRILTLYNDLFEAQDTLNAFRWIPSTCSTSSTTKTAGACPPQGAPPQTPSRRMHVTYMTPSKHVHDVSHVSRPLPRLAIPPLETLRDDDEAMDPCTTGSIPVSLDPAPVLDDHERGSVDVGLGGPTAEMAELMDGNPEVNGATARDTSSDVDAYTHPDAPTEPVHTSSPATMPGSDVDAHSHPDAPTEPTPTEPALNEPSPAEPSPAEPAPTEPAPTEPVHTSSPATMPSSDVDAHTRPDAPTEPTPTEPAPTEPSPTAPVHTSSPATMSAEPDTMMTVSTRSKRKQQPRGKHSGQPAKRAKTSTGKVQAQSASGASLPSRPTRPKAPAAPMTPLKTRGRARREAQEAVAGGQREVGEAVGMQ